MILNLFNQVNKYKFISTSYSCRQVYIFTGDTSKTGKSVSGKISTVTGDTELKMVAAGEQGTLDGGKAGV